MLFKFLQKTILMGGAGGAIYLSNSLDTDNNLINNKHKISESSLPQRISKLEDISIYEDFYGCKFAFINRWAGSDVHDSQGFLEKYKNEEVWVNSVITGANLVKDKCKTQKVVTLSFRNKVARYYVP